MEFGCKHRKEDMPTTPDHRRRALAQHILGIAGWICSMTVPEALFAWSYLAQYSSNPNNAVIKDIKRLFRYFKWLLEENLEGLIFRLHSLNVPHIGTVGASQLYGYVDSTHISEERSVSRYGVCLFIHGMLILALSKKLTYVTLSATESEYVGLSEGMKLALFIHDLLNELGEKQTQFIIGNDNSGAIAIAENKGCNAGRVRHIQARVHWIQDLVDSGTVSLRKVPTKFMTADALTKALAYPDHGRHATNLKGIKFPL
jgi:hypothetical protein